MTDPRQLAALQEAVEDLAGAALGARPTFCVPWTDVVNADPVADVRALERLVGQGSGRGVNSLDDALANRVIAGAKVEDGRMLILLDGGEALWVWPDDGDAHASLDPGGRGRSGHSGRNERMSLGWRYATDPHPRELLGLGAPPRPRPGHAVDQEARRADQATAKSAGGQGCVAVGRPDGCVRLVGARDLDGVYERVGD